MLPPAPGLFSTTNCWPNSSEILAATTRARMSVVPPAANGTISLTGRVAHPSARARRGHSDSAPSAAPAIRSERRLECEAKIEAGMNGPLNDEGNFAAPYALTGFIASVKPGSLNLAAALPCLRHQGAKPDQSGDRYRGEEQER